MKQGPEFDFLSIVPHFAFEGDFLEAARYGQGHINDTFAARFRLPDGRIRRYLVQRINTRVFREPERLMENIQAVTTFLRQRILAAGGDPRRETLTLIPDGGGRPYYRDPDGGVWRAYVFIEGARTYQLARSPDQMLQAGRAFGTFQRQLADFPAGRLHETIPHFHDTPARIRALEDAVRRDPAGRAAGVAAEIAFVRERAAEAGRLQEGLAEGRLPLRVTHNDTKLNNVMIDDATGAAVCVIDLDTVMPGLSLYDFGDAIRSGTSTAEEDERDLEKVAMDPALFEGFARGFLETAGPALTDAETNLLAFSAKLITLEIGVRFLADHLEGDVYFRIHRTGHNLDRARNQFRLVADMEAQMPRMEAIIHRLCGPSPHP